MKTRLRQADTLDEQQLARKCDIRDSWSVQERERRQRASRLRQQWLIGLMLGATNRAYALHDFPPLLQLHYNRFLIRTLARRRANCRHSSVTFPPVSKRK